MGNLSCIFHKYLPHVLGEVPAVGVPGAVLLDGQGAGGDILGRVPGDEPDAGMGGTKEVAACNTADGCKAGWTTRGAVLPRRGEPPMGRRRINLQVALVEGDSAIGCDFLGGSAAHVVIGTFLAHAVVVLGKEHGAVLGIVGHVPDSCARLDSRLVAVKVVGWGEGAFRFFDGGVLVEPVGG